MRDFLCLYISKGIGLGLASRDRLFAVGKRSVWAVSFTFSADRSSAHRWASSLERRTSGTIRLIASGTLACFTDMVSCHSIRIFVLILLSLLDWLSLLTWTKATTKPSLGMYCSELQLGISTTSSFRGEHHFYPISKGRRSMWLTIEVD